MYGEHSLTHSHMPTHKYTFEFTGDPRRDYIKATSKQGDIKYEWERLQ